MTFSLPAAYAGLEPAPVWAHFASLNAIPRPSGQESQVRAHIENLARERGFESRTDARGNLVVAVPARGNGNAGAPILVLQSHLDMVCQKRPEVVHDFESDPILPRRVGDKIEASGTTLGADNGMGAAMMMAVLTGDDLSHGPIELLFTVEEETGLYGAALLDGSIVQGRTLVNLDSEDPEEITIGCAGGAGTTLHLPLERENWAGAQIFELKMGGLAGGHSGMQIHEPLGNAIKILTEILSAAGDSIRLVSLEGGTAHNAIPRDCVAVVATQNVGELEDFWKSETERLTHKWRGSESGIDFQKREIESESAPMTAQKSRDLLTLLTALPHGVQAMSARFEGKVQTSSNLAEARTTHDKAEIHISNRSFLACDIAEMQDLCATLGKKIGAEIEVRDGYPGWEPKGDSALLQTTIAAFKEVFGKAPKVDVVHAGLECGLLSEKLPGLEAVSFGPLIRGAHTPEEWVSIESVEEIWRVLKCVLETV